MAFGPVLGRIFPGPFSYGEEEEETHWWLSGVLTPTGCLAAYTPKGAASLAASYDNNAAPGNGLPDGTYDCTLGTAPSFAAATGWGFLAASKQYMLTGLIPTNAYSMIIRFSDCLTTGTYRVPAGMRATNATSYFGFFMPGILTKSTLIDSLFTVDVNIAASGVWTIASNSAYVDGVDVGGAGTPIAWTGLGIYIGALNVAGAGGFWWTGNIQAVAIYNYKLVQEEVDALTTATNII